jgi:hypothetical protein
VAVPILVILGDHSLDPGFVIGIFLGIGSLDKSLR